MTAHMAFLSPIKILLLAGVFGVNVLSSPILLETARADVSDYALAEGDVLEFDILDDVDPPRQLVVANDGRVQVPLLGPVNVSGMTLPEARNELRQKFIDRELFNDPQIGLSVVNYRPVFVLGDVKSPGSYPFQIQLTVEKAVGLAGGINTGLSNTEDRILTRVRVRGELQGYESDLAREAMWAARLTAQLDDRTEIAIEDTPKGARPYVNEQLLAQLRQGEEKILKVDADEYASQIKLVTQSIDETDSQIEILEKLAENQKETIKYSEDELKRANKLLESGLKTVIEISRIQRQLTSDEGRLLQVYSDMSDAHRQSTSLKRELSQLQATRKRDALSQLQERQVAIEKLLASRATAEEQLLLVSNLIAEDSKNTPKFRMQYKIRHLSNGKAEELPATGTTDLTPGDVVLVSVERVQLSPVAPESHSTGSGISVLQ
jgi:polysaccharide biosynthesis/export protein ExoF